MTREFASSRWNADPPHASRIECGDHVLWPWRGGAGWGETCGVDTFTNLYLGVPAKSAGKYSLRIRTEGMSASCLRVYANGRFYEASKTPDGYGADVFIDYDRLSTPAVPCRPNPNAAGTNEGEMDSPAVQRQIYVMEATCPHLGADLSHADIEEYDDSLVAVCPWHR